MSILRNNGVIRVYTGRSKRALCPSSQIKTQFKNTNGNMTETWNIINKALGKQNKKADLKQVQCNDTVINDTHEICQAFNNYFVNIGETLPSTFQQTDRTDFYDFISYNERTAYFKPITSAEIIDIVKCFKNNTSLGYDDVNIKVVKRVIYAISSHLCAIFNQAIEQGTFPDDMKIARVTPVFKNDSPELLSNYRPILVLPVFSKIFEKCIYSRLSNFISTVCLKKNGTSPNYFFIISKSHPT